MPRSTEAGPSATPPNPSVRPARMGPSVARGRIGRTDGMDPVALSPVETASPDEVRALQDRKLRAQMAYLKARSPFVAGKLSPGGRFVRGYPNGRRSRRPALHHQAGAAREPAFAPPVRQSRGGRPGSYRAGPRIVRHHRRAVLRPGDGARLRAVAGGVRRVFWCQGVRPTSTVAMGFSIGFFVGGIPARAGDRGSRRDLPADRRGRDQTGCSTPSPAWRPTRSPARRPMRSIWRRRPVRAASTWRSSASNGWRSARSPAAGFPKSAAISRKPGRPG